MPTDEALNSEPTTPRRRPRRRRCEIFISFLIVLACLSWYISTHLPRTWVRSWCCVCGREREETWLAGIKVQDRLRETGISVWLAPRRVGHQQHHWLTATYQRYVPLHGSEVGCFGDRLLRRLDARRLECQPDLWNQLIAEYESLLPGENEQISAAELEHRLERFADERLVPVKCP